MQGEWQDVDFPVAEKNEVVKKSTSFFRNAVKRMECLTADGVESWWLTWWIS